MPQRYGLGKGLDALIPTGEPAAAVAGGVTQVEVDHIQRNPRQPRLNIRAQELSELAASISLHGVIQPLIVSPAEKRYTDRQNGAAGSPKQAPESTIVRMPATRSFELR
jgi:ParB family chromosome partitioning protein